MSDSLLNGDRAIAIGADSPIGGPRVAGNKAVYSTKPYRISDLDGPVTMHPGGKLRMSSKPKLFQILLVDPNALRDFLYSCAATEILAKDTKIITEPTGLLWLGIGQYFPGGTAKRVTETLTTNERKILAVAGYKALLKAYTGVLHQPAEQVKFLQALESNRSQQMANVQGLFKEANAANYQMDSALYHAAKFTNDLQSVCCISLAVLATGGGLAAAGGMTTLGGLGLSTATAGKLFAVTLGTKMIIAGAQSDKDLASLGGFALGTFQNGLLTLGELSTKAFDLTKDALINGSQNRMMRVIADLFGEMSKSTDRLAVLQARLDEIAAMAPKVKPTSFIAGHMAEDAKAINAEIAQLRAGINQASQAAVGASKTSQWMKNFGGKAVPLVCLAADVVNETLRHQDVEAQIERGGMRPPPAARR